MAKLIYLLFMACCACIIMYGGYTWKLRWTIPLRIVTGGCFLGWTIQAFFTFTLYWVIACFILSWIVGGIIISKLKDKTQVTIPLLALFLFISLFFI